MLVLLNQTFISSKKSNNEINSFGTSCTKMHKPQFQQLSTGIIGFYFIYLFIYSFLALRPSLLCTGTFYRARKLLRSCSVTTPPYLLPCHVAYSWQWVGGQRGMEDGIGESKAKKLEERKKECSLCQEKVCRAVTGSSWDCDFYQFGIIIQVPFSLREETISLANRVHILITLLKGLMHVTAGCSY